MKKVIMALGLSMLSTLFVFGQSADIKRGEFYVGYSNGQIDTGVDSGSSINAFFRDRANFNGAEVSGVYNLGRYFGIKGDFSAHFQSQRLNEVFPGTTGRLPSIPGTLIPCTTFSAAFRSRTIGTAERGSRLLTR